MKYSISEVQQILAATWLHQAGTDTEVEHLLLDSRQISAPTVSLFFALPGKRHDGHRYLDALYQAGVPVLFQLKVQRDPGTGRPRAVLVPDALGLGDPTFYMSGDPAVQEIGGIYRAYSADLLRYSGVPGKQLAAQSAAALTIEDALAKAMFGSEASVELAQADKSFPQLQLGAFVRQTGAAPERLVLANGEFFKTLEKMLAKPAIPQWQAYLRMRVLQSMAPMLGKDYRLAYSNLVDQAIAKRLPRTQGERVSALVLEQAPDLLSAAYAERQMSDSEVRSAEAMGEALRAAMGRAIDRAPQLDAERKAAAHRQLAALRLAIGRPLQPTTIFDGLAFDRSQYATNVLMLRRWAKARELALLTAPDWPSPVSQTQPLIGFEASQNRVIVTAAALQAPVFGRVNPAADYGALGALIGREISLGYDSLLAGAFDSATSDFGTTTDSCHGVLNRGSSKHGTNRRANTAWPSGDCT